MTQNSDNWSKYEAMKQRGRSPQEIYRAGIADGLDWAASIRLLRALFDLDLPGAKEVTLQADGIGNSLDEYQESLLPAIEQALADAERENRHD